MFLIKLSDPPKSNKFITKINADTLLSDISTSFAAASAVPPVAIKSSIIKTLSFSSKESLWTSIVATIEVHKDSLDEKDSVLIIDDLIATGGTAEAAAKLVEMSESKVSAFIFVINLFDLGGSDNLIKNNYKVENLIDFPGH